MSGAAITMTATYSDTEWESDEPDTDPTITSGFTDPRNPWGGFHSEVPEGLVGEAFTEWCKDNVERLEFDDVNEAAEFIAEFPGGVWDWSESEPDLNYRTGVYTEVTLHVESTSTVVFEGPTIQVVNDPAAAAMNLATTLQALRDAHLAQLNERRLARI